MNGTHSRRKGRARVRVRPWIVLVLAALVGSSTPAMAASDSDEARARTEQQEELRERAAGLRELLGFGKQDDGDDDIGRGVGIIGDVDFDGPTVVINGIRYDFMADADIEIGGTFGAPTLLRKGMRVTFAYRPGGLHAGSIVELSELSPRDESAEPY